MGAVYDATTPSTLADVLPAAASDNDRDEREPVAAPVARNKLADRRRRRGRRHSRRQDLRRADRRDPDHQRAWVALIDGANQQIDRINAEPDARGIDVTIVVDFVPLIEYLWGAAWCLFDEGDPAAEQFVRPRPEGSWPATPAESPPPSAAKPAVTAWTPTTSHLPGALAPRHAQQSHRDALWRDVPHLRMLRCEDA